MSLVWRKLRRSNQEACKYRFTATFQELMVQCSGRWHPDKITVCWIRKRSGRSSRHIETKAHKWEPALTDPTRGLVIWPTVTPESLEIETTLYKDKRTKAFDDKEWTFVVKELTPSGKTRPLATVPLNLPFFRNDVPGTSTEVKLKLRPCYKHVASAVMQLVLTCTLMCQGDAMDDDMQSISSFMSAKMNRGLAEDGLDRNSLSDTHESTDPAASSLSGSDSTHMATKIADLVREINSFPSSSDDGFTNLSPMKQSVSNYSNGAGTGPGVDETHENQTGRPADFDRMRDKSKLDRDSSGSNGLGPSTAGIMKRDGSSDGGLRTSTPKTHPYDPSPMSKSESVHRAGSEDRSRALGESPREPLDQLASPVSNGPGQADSGISLDTTLTSQDLLAWCQEITKNYKGVRITNFGACWRNGLGFAAIVHHFRPDLIDFDALSDGHSPAAIEDNCKKAFDAATKLGIPRLIKPEDMKIMAIPDKIDLIAYVHLLRSHFAGAKAEDIGEIWNPRHSLISLSEIDNRVAEEFEKLRAARERESAFDLQSDSGSLRKYPPGEVYNSPQHIRESSFLDSPTIKSSIHFNTPNSPDFPPASDSSGFTAGKHLPTSGIRNGNNNSEYLSPISDRTMMIIDSTPGDFSPRPSSYGLKSAKNQSILHPPDSPTTSRKEMRGGSPRDHSTALADDFSSNEGSHLTSDGVVFRPTSSALKSVIHSAASSTGAGASSASGGSFANTKRNSRRSQANRRNSNSGSARRSSASGSSERSGSRSSSEREKSLSLRLSAADTVNGTIKPVLMTREELMNPFDDLSEGSSSSKTTDNMDCGSSKSTGKLISTSISDQNADSSRNIGLHSTAGDSMNRRNETVRLSGELSLIVSNGSGSGSGINNSGTGPENDVKRRARALLDQFVKEHNDVANEKQQHSGTDQSATSIMRQLPPSNNINNGEEGGLDELQSVGVAGVEEEEDDHKKQLRLRARQLIAEAKEQALGGRPIKISETLPAGSLANSNYFSNSSGQSATLRIPVGGVNSAHSTNGKEESGATLTRSSQSAPASRTQTPESKLLRPRINFYQFNSHATIDENKATSPSREFPVHLQQDAEDWSGSFDRFKRFGSMKAAELTAITTQLSKSIRSYSLPKELNRDVLVPPCKMAVPHSLSVSTGRPDLPPQKTMSSPVERGIESVYAIASELEMISRRQTEMDKQASAVEKKLRRLMQEEGGKRSPDEEELLTNEFLTLLNERNQLTRREYHLQLLQKISEHERRFNLVQQELAQLIGIDEKEKTENVKERIDHLMNELIVLVNKRDELAQQLINNEHGTEEDEDTGRDALAQVPVYAKGEGGLVNMQDNNCAIQ